MDKKLCIVAFLVLCVAWQGHCAVNCTQTGAGRFAEPTDTTCKNYTLCVYVATSNSFVGYNYVCPTTSLFSTVISQCTAPTNFVCNVPTTNTTASSSVCTADGFIADPNSTNCGSYIECVGINSTFVETTYTCPANTFYDPNTTLCESNYNCTTTTAFTCSAAGRFANSADTTCQTYHFCVLASNGTYVDYMYTCPNTSVFNPNSRLCTTSYTCGS